ncbi:MAG: hypothetical protein K2Q21_13400 [Chitinophagaceae bacterium]|nr:hypothetical protein [Chitinophagaceae bacterium]
MKKIKEEDLMSYLYKEASPAMVKAIEQAMIDDPSIKDQLALLQFSMKHLERLKLESPSAESVQAILKYAALHKKPD